LSQFCSKIIPNRAEGDSIGPDLLLYTSHVKQSVINGEIQDKKIDLDDKEILFHLAYFVWGRLFCLEIFTWGDFPFKIISGE
jgi:hypothetical protein